MDLILIDLQLLIFNKNLFFNLSIVIWTSICTYNAQEISAHLHVKALHTIGLKQETNSTSGYIIKTSMIQKYLRCKWQVQGCTKLTAFYWRIRYTHLVIYVKVSVLLIAIKNFHLKNILFVY
jgi:hypothetical protein